jgi:hypothetical protein
MFLVELHLDVVLEVLLVVRFKFFLQHRQIIIRMDSQTETRMDNHTNKHWHT